MRTTIDLPEELLRQARSRAALDGVRFKDLIADCVRYGLEQRGTKASGGRVRKPRRSPPPVIIARRGVPIPALSAAEVRRIEEGEDEALHA
jgi:hypothetical protein